MAAPFRHSGFSQVQCSSLIKSKYQNKIIQSVALGMKPFRYPTLGTTVSLKCPIRKPSRRSTPVMAVSATNFLDVIVVGNNISINSPQAGQQTSSGPASISKTQGVSEVLEEHRIENGGGGDGSNGPLPPSGGGGGSGGGRGEDDKGSDEEKFGAIMNFEDVTREAEKRGAILPSDMVEAAKTHGIRSEFVWRYLGLQMTWPLSFLMRYCSMIRNRMLADPSFLFKVGTEVLTDSCSATFAEYQKKGEKFWSEFNMFAANFLAGVTIDIAVVGMLAPYARMAPMPSVSGGVLGHLQLVASLPSSVFEAGSQGIKFSLLQRIATYFYKGSLIAAVGFGCALFYHGIVYSLTTGSRNTKKSEEEAPVSLVKRAAQWGVFLGVSGNTRYQIINGLEQLVQSSPLAKQFPAFALAFTVGVRFANNIYDGLQFEDWANWSGMMKCDL